MKNDPARSTEQPPAGVVSPAAPPEWAKHLERLVDTVQQLVGAIQELGAAVARMTARVDEMYVDAAAGMYIDDEEKPLRATPSIVDEEQKSS